MILIAYRRRGAHVWSHHFRVRACEWKSLYRQARLYRTTMAYAVVKGGEYTDLL